VFLEGPAGNVYHIWYSEQNWELNKKIQSERARHELTQKKIADIKKQGISNPKLEELISRLEKKVPKELSELTDVDTTPNWSQFDSLSTAQVSPTPPVVLFDVFPTIGNTIINDLGDPTYNGFAFDNCYSLMTCGATSWVFNPPQDYTYTNYIKVYADPAIAMLGDMTIETNIFIDPTQTASDNPRIFSKQQYYGAFELIYNVENECLNLIRWTEDNNYDQWDSEPGSVPIGEWYYIQLLWRSGSGPVDEAPPVIILDGTQLTLVNSVQGSGYWDGDYYNDLYIGNTYLLDGSGDFVGIMSIFRLYNILTLDPTVDFNTDAWRRDPADYDAQLVYNFFPQAGTLADTGGGTQ
jgi:hypothetical protein